MSAADPEPGPQHLALVGYEHEWPADFEAFVARELVGRDGVFVARLAEVGEAPTFLRASDVTALIVNSHRLGLKAMVALRECRRISPATAVVVITTTATHGLKDALEGGATAFVSWPASPEVIRRALKSGRASLSPAPGATRRERGGIDGRS